MPIPQAPTTTFFSLRVIDLFLDRAGNRGLHREDGRRYCRRLPDHFSSGCSVPDRCRSRNEYADVGTRFGSGQSSDASKAAVFISFNPRLAGWRATPTGPDGLLPWTSSSTTQQDCSARTQDLKGRRVLVTAGPTVEDIDPVRFLSNRSSGKMGFAIAQAARTRGAEVTLDIRANRSGIPGSRARAVHRRDAAGRSRTL